MKNLLFVVVLGIVFSCQEDIVPDYPFHSFGETVTIARSGDGTELKALTAKDSEGNNIIIFNINGRCLDDTYKINIWLTKDYRAFLRFTYQQDYVSSSSCVSYIVSILSEDEIRMITENFLHEIIVEYYNKEGDRIVREFKPYSENKLKEVIEPIYNEGGGAIKRVNDRL